MRCTAVYLLGVPSTYVCRRFFSLHGTVRSCANDDRSLAIIKRRAIEKKKVEEFNSKKDVFYSRTLHTSYLQPMYSPLPPPHTMHPHCTLNSAQLQSKHQAQPLQNSTTQEKETAKTKQKKICTKPSTHSAASEVHSIQSSPTEPHRGFNLPLKY